MIYIRWNTSPAKYMSGLIILLLTPALLLNSACLPTLPPAPPIPPAPPPNEPPIISSLTAEQEVPTLSETQITCEASDADGDGLAYQWSADSGTIKGEGSSITWVTPDTAGNYNVEVTVTDDKGGTTSKHTTIAVIDKPNQPPVIIDLTRDGTPVTEQNRVREWRTITVHCRAEDPDGDQLNYLWRTTGGKINGEGSTVGWTSPGVPGDCTVTVLVTDGRGNKAEASVVFTVACCGGGF